MKFHNELYVEICYLKECVLPNVVMCSIVIEYISGYRPRKPVRIVDKLWDCRVWKIWLMTYILWKTIIYLWTLMRRFAKRYKNYKRVINNRTIRSISLMCKLLLKKQNTILPRSNGTNITTRYKYWKNN